LFAALLFNITAQVALIYVPLLSVCYYLGAAVAAVHTYRKAVMITLKIDE
jgi:hypothetical protein